MSISRCPFHQQNHSSHHRGTLEDHLRSDQIAPIPKLSDREWNGLRRGALLDFLIGFLSLRNLIYYRGRYNRDIIGFGWAALYQTLRVPSIVSTTYRNEGHLRAGERIFGTGEFVEIFRLPRGDRFLHDMIRVINLRHHVAGVVLPSGVVNLPEGQSGADVFPGYEADYAYISASFAENLMRGYRACGLRPGSRSWRRIGGRLAAILYQSAGATGLHRAPRDFAAHEDFCRSYETRFLNNPPGDRLAGMARDIARRILPITAALTGIPMEEHLERHVDPVSREWLFPDRGITDELRGEHARWLTLSGDRAWKSREAERQQQRDELWSRPDVAALWKAYLRIPPSSTDSRLMGAILLHAIDDPGASYRVEELRLGAGEPLLRQGEVSKRMIVVLDSSQPLLVHRSDPCTGERQLEEITAPAIVGDLGLLANRPELASTGPGREAVLQVMFIDRTQYSSLSTQSGFRVAVAADVQRDIQVGVKGMIGILADHPEMESDAGYRSLVILLGHLCDQHLFDLSEVKGLSDHATVQECVEFLRTLVPDVERRLGNRHHLQQHIREIVSLSRCGITL